MNRVCWVWMILFLWLPSRARSADETFRQGIAALQARDYDQALSCFNTVLQTNRDLAAAYECRGLAHAGKLAFDEALADYAEAIRLSPKTPGTYYNRGNARLAQKQYDLAIADFTQAISLNATYAEAYNNRGLAHVGKRDFEQAIADHGQAIRFDSHHDGTLYLNRGLAYLGAQDYDKARDDFSEALRLDPRLPSARFHRGNACVWKKEFDQALADYTESLALDPNLAAAWNNRGNIHLVRKEYEQAIGDYTEAIRLEPKTAAGYFNRGLAHAGMKDHQRAIADHDQAVRLAPDDARSPGLVYLGSAAYDGAVFQAGGAATPSYLEAYYQRGNRRLEHQEFDHAIADYTSALRICPNDSRTLTNRGAAHAGKREFDKAREDFTALTRLDPNSADAYYRRGLVSLCQNNFERAIADFSEAINFDPSHAPAYHARGWAWSGLDKPDKAAADHQKAARLDPDQDGTAVSLAIVARWQRLAVDLPDDDGPAKPAPFPVPAAEVAELNPTDADAVAVANPVVVPAIAWDEADTADTSSVPDTPQPVEAPLATLPPTRLVLTSEPEAIATRPNSHNPAAPAEHLDNPARPDRAGAPGDFWHSPAPMFLAVVLAALVLGAGMVSIPLLLLWPRLSKSRNESIDIEKLISALLRDRDRASTAQGQPVVANPGSPPRVIAPAAIPATLGRKEEAGLEGGLFQHILDDNLRLREDDAPVGEPAA